MTVNRGVVRTPIGLKSNVNVPVGVPNPLCWMPLISTVELFRGTGTATFTRSTIATFVDKDDGLVKTSPSTGGVLQARFEKEGYLHEGASTNEALNNRDFTDADWATPNITPLKDAVGADGVANAASSLEATAGNATALQLVTKASARNTFSIDVRRKSGTGTIEITDDGSSFTAITINNTTYTRFQITTTQANPLFGVRIVTSGDEIEVDYAQLEVQPAATSRIETAAIPESRTIERLDIPVTNIPNGPNSFSVAIEIAPFWIGTSNGAADLVAWSTAGETNSNRFRQINGTDNFDWQVANTTVETNPATASTNLIKYVGTLDEGVETLIYVDGVAQIDTESGSRGTTTITTISIGSQTTILPWFGHLQDFRVYDVVLTPSQVKTI